MDRGRKWLAHFNAGKTQLVSFDWSNNTDAIDVEMNGSVFEEKSSASRKIGAFDSFFKVSFSWGCSVSL